MTTRKSDEIITTRQIERKSSAHYQYRVVAGSRSKPGGFIGQYPTKREAIAHLPRYAAYIKRVTS